MIKPADAVAAITPPVATVTAGQIHSGLGIATGIVSLGFLLWRWHRDWKKAQAEDAAAVQQEAKGD